MSTDAVIATPLGPVRIETARGHLVGIQLQPAHRGTGTLADEPLLQKTAEQLAAYFENPRSRFDVPVELAGSPFQCRVWKALRALAPGEVVTYGELAEQLDSGARAVGNACRRNPVPLVVPCHRVVAAAGLGGYAGARNGERLAMKRWLLAHEGATR